MDPIRLNWQKYKRRVARSNGPTCRICGQRIASGDEYYECFMPCHTKCVEAQAMMLSKRQADNKRTDWYKYKLRVCKSMHECRLCRYNISIGQAYYDGGYGKRAHVACVEEEARK